MHRQRLFVETPPHTWGILFIASARVLQNRNTPTHVGNTASRNSRLPPGQKHPHTRGEYFNRAHCRESCRETPPHTWGIRLRDDKKATRGRNTPTHVGNTALRHPPGFVLRKHPHTRGEYDVLPSFSRIAGETPPHTWGIQSVAFLRGT